MEKPKYVIIAGINGAGKSTLYRLQPELFNSTERINADEILQKMGGDWRKEIDNFRAMREEVKQLHDALNNCKSIHVETTLAGSGKAQLNLIDEAHKKGFEVTLLYVTVNSAEMAIDRVQERVENGGHGIPQETIKKRYSQSYNNLPVVSFKSDNVFIYDNSKRFVNVYTRKHNQVEINNLKQYPWINQGVTFSKKIQTQLEKFVENNPTITGKLDKTIKRITLKFRVILFIFIRLI